MAKRGKPPQARKKSPAEAPDVRKLALIGHAWEAHNRCANCEGILMAQDMHYHTRNIWDRAGAEAICCLCAPGDRGCKKNFKPLAEPTKNVVQDQRTALSSPVQGRTENNDVSKTSQKNEKVAKAMKGQKEAKAEKATNGKAPKEAKAKHEFKFEALPKSFKGNVAGQIQSSGSFFDVIHRVEDASTLCGYDTQVPSKGALRLGVNWKEVKDEVNCGRCLRAIARAEAESEKPAKEAKPKAEKKAKAAAK